VLDHASQTAAPGGTVTFSGAIVNNENATVDLNSLNINLAASGLFPDNSPFFAGPLWVDPLDATDSFDLFQVTVDNPFLDTQGGAYRNHRSAGRDRGVDGYDGSTQTLLGSAEFSVTVESAVPEASRVALLALAGVVASWRRRPGVRLRHIVESEGAG
jgi:hypothetical protein